MAENRQNGENVFICRLSTYQCLDCSPSAEIVFAAITNFQIITLFFESILIQFIPATRFNIIYEFYYIKTKCDD